MIHQDSLKKLSDYPIPNEWGFVPIKEGDKAPPGLGRKSTIVG